MTSEFLDKLSNQFDFLCMAKEMFGSEDFNDNDKNMVEIACGFAKAIFNNDDYTFEQSLNLVKGVFKPETYDKIIHELFMNYKPTNDFNGVIKELEEQNEFSSDDEFLDDGENGIIPTDYNKVDVIKSHKVFEYDNGIKIHVVKDGNKIVQYIIEEGTDLQDFVNLITKFKREAMDVETVIKFDNFKLPIKMINGVITIENIKRIDSESRKYEVLGLIGIISNLGC